MVDTTLPTSTFYTVVQHAPLVSIDLVILNQDNQILVGKRRNNPAKGVYFVPGARVLKNESLPTALQRVSKFELDLELKKVKFLGIYDHLYDTNFLDEKCGTHYVCIAVQSIVNPSEETRLTAQFAKQHSELKWLTKPELLASPDVHQYTKNYFIDAPNKF